MCAGVHKGAGIWFIWQSLSFNKHTHQSFSLEMWNRFKSFSITPTLSFWQKYIWSQKTKLRKHRSVCVCVHGRTNAIGASSIRNWRIIHIFKDSYIQWNAYGPVHTHTNTRACTDPITRHISLIRFVCLSVEFLLLFPLSWNVRRSSFLSFNWKLI